MPCDDRMGSLATLLAAASALAAAAPALADDAAYRFRHEPIQWSACAASDAVIDGLQCATYAVPLDYRAENGPTIALALRRMPAGAASRSAPSSSIPADRAAPAACSSPNGTASSPPPCAGPSTS